MIRVQNPQQHMRGIYAMACGIGDLLDLPGGGAARHFSIGAESYSAWIGNKAGSSAVKSHDLQHFVQHLTAHHCINLRLPL
jgi:hypothetical protein